MLDVVLEKSFHPNLSQRLYLFVMFSLGRRSDVVHVGTISDRQLPSWSPPSMDLDPWTKALADHQRAGW